jgi:N-acetylmuramoyl-L-alanine amidase
VAQGRGSGDEGEEGGLDAALGEALAAGAGEEARPAPRPFDARPEGTEEPSEGPARVSEVRSWTGPGYTRVAVYLSRAVPFERRELPAAPGLPRRLALDLSPAVLEGATAAHPVGDAQVERVRTAQHGEETVRVVLDLHGSEDAQVIAVDDPPRLLVDVGAPAAPSAARPAGPARPEAELAGARPVRRVVVDAGHGGHDAGAVGPTGVREKDVTLAIARRLASRLEAAGYEVLLTRRDDRYLALEERTAFANAHRGDLFISVHANAHPRRDRRGVETYVLNVADDRYAARLAARENGALRDEAGEGREVRRILSDLDAQASSDASRRLAGLVQREVLSATRSSAGETRDLGVKSALFYVLLGARMPAVLVETAFLSNRVEERRLRDPRFQEAVAASIARGVRSFARSEARLAAR